MMQFPSHAIARATNVEPNGAWSKSLGKNLAIAGVIAQIGNNKCGRIVLPINGCQSLYAIGAKQVLRQFNKPLHANKRAHKRAQPTDDGGGAITTTPDVVRDNRWLVEPRTWIVSLDGHVRLLLSR